MDKYQQVKGEIANKEDTIENIDDEIQEIGEVSSKSGYFDSIQISLTPSKKDLPSNIQDEIDDLINKQETLLLNKINKIVLDKQKDLVKKKKAIDKEISQLEKDNKDLFDKYNKNQELESLVKKQNEYESTLKKIDRLKKKKVTASKKLTTSQNKLKSLLKDRNKIYSTLENKFVKIDQEALKEISFGIDIAISKPSVEKVQQKINVREVTEFMKRYELDIQAVRKKPIAFINSVYSGKQKIKSGSKKIQIVQDALTLSEEMLFTAEMEGDQIGGFSESTMTPGKRALFALRLMLAESEDKWPLLIDQPEDDLDSRSIFDEVVPFLRQKKKERQIIIVSHNANLVIGVDSEQIIVANRHGDDRVNEDGKEFNYLSGSIENTQELAEDCEDTLKAQGIKEHACQILEGGVVAFELRSNRYNIKQ